jgi:hypothetical protein
VASIERDEAEEIMRRSAGRKKGRKSDETLVEEGLSEAHMAIHVELSRREE